MVREKGACTDDQLVRACRSAGYSARVIPVRRVTITVRDMDCTGCPERVKRAIRRVGGVRRVNLQGSEKARVFFDKSRTCKNDIIDAVRRAGFTPE